MNWIKLPIEGEGIKLVNLDRIETIGPSDKGSSLITISGTTISSLIDFETLCNQIQPILTTTDVAGNEL
jgi:hypothetical protein